MLGHRFRFLPSSGPIAARNLSNLGELRQLAIDQTVGRQIHQRLAQDPSLTDTAAAKTVMLHVGNQRVIVTKDPAVYKPAFGSYRKKFKPSSACRAELAFYAPQSLFVLTGGNDTRVRQVLDDVLAQQHLDHIPACVERSIDKLAASPFVVMTISPKKTLHELAFDLFHEAVCQVDARSIDCDPLELETLSSATEALNAPMLQALWQLPAGGICHANRGLIHLQEYAKALIAACRAKSSTSKSFLDRLVAATDAGMLSEAELRDNFIGLFLVAHHTTLNALAALLDTVAKRPIIQTQLREALFAAFPRGADDIAVATSSALEAVPFLQWTIDEALQVAPETSVISRQCTSPCVLGGVQFFAGDNVLVDITEAGLPVSSAGGCDYFVSGHVHDAEAVSSWRPTTGLEPQPCPARKLALVQIRAIAAYVIARFVVSPAATALGAFRHHFDVSPSFRYVTNHFMPRSLVVVDHGDWTRIRKTLRRAHTLPHLVASSIDKLDAQLATADTDVITVVPEEAMPKLTFDIIHRVLYQWDPDTVSDAPETTSMLRAALEVSEVMAERLLLPFPSLWSLPLARNRMADTARATLRAKVENLVGERRAYLRSLEDLPRPTLLDFMLAALDNDELSEDEVYDNVMGFFIAGFDTTSNGLSSLLNFLALHQDQNCDRPFLSVFPVGQQPSAATPKELDACTYLGWTLDEILRLSPPATGMLRDCVKACEIAGVRFDVGDEIYFDSHGAAMDPDNYPSNMTDHDAFRPERWESLSYNKSVAMQFGAGPRMCLGHVIAMAELKAVCAYVVSNYELFRRADGLPSSSTRHSPWASRKDTP
ncbi:hypothetical protein ACHHYP_10757 [Achlya hypogyna]|uniref:Cytochrome P450 n=1 Tax=Achlya hypogyna TaxID=1202772 RepID=A0A1V9ZHQ8_ACHHY|nr:hypothetical protein ACHHYP_10757 [Achlya hypogyna]